NFQLTGWTKSPCRGQGLASEAPDGLVVEGNTVGVMGTASKRGVSIVHDEASDLDAHMIERAAAWLDERSILRGFPLNKEYDLRFHLLCNGERRITGRKIVNKIRRPQGSVMRHQEIRKVMSPQPFHHEIRQRWIRPDENLLLGTR